jgi:hypothetical protein
MRKVTQHFLRTTHARSLHSLSFINKQTFMVTAEAVKKSEKKARSEKKEDNAISGQVNGNFSIYPFLLNLRNTTLASLLLLNLSHVFIVFVIDHIL